MNLFLILIPQSLNSQFLNLAPYSHYDEGDVQKTDLILRSNNEVCMYYIVAYLLRWDLRLFLAKTGFGIVSQFSSGSIQLRSRSMNSCMAGM